MLILVPGLTSEAAQDLSFDRPECARGSLRPLPLELDPEEVLLSGSLESGNGTDIRKVLATYGLTTEELDLEEESGDGYELSAVERVRSALALGTDLVIVRAGVCDRWTRLTAALEGVNLLIVGHSTSPQRSGFVAIGPDIIAGDIEGSPVDLQPSLLGHFEVLPPPGPAPEGRLLHQIFRWAHPRAEDEIDVWTSGTGAGSAAGRGLE
ncbi:MAG: hypothetical protein CME06_16245 [Gemmatimonadetes bacterium]|nr:hypothetical protein [Gemmatimonadota bacterium]